MDYEYTEEQFSHWSQQKQLLNKRTDTLHYFVNIGEIWYVKLGINIGFEQNGKEEYQRPVLVVKRIGILFFVVPLSTKRKDNPFYYELVSTHFTKPSLAILSQVRVIDKKRFVNSIGSVSNEELIVIKKLLKNLYLPGV